MNWLRDLIHNPFLITAVSSWLIAQVLKTVIYAVMNRKFDIHRLFGDGGMPSGHSATVSSLAMIALLVYGADSFAFAVSTILAIIVCHDAMGVRRETGRQAVVINAMADMIAVLNSEELPQEKLKELVGHSPLQVFAGILLGLANAFAMYEWLL